MTQKNPLAVGTATASKPEETPSQELLLKSETRSYRFPCAPATFVTAAGKAHVAHDGTFTTSDPELIELLEGMVEVGNIYREDPSLARTSRQIAPAPVPPSGVIS